MTGYQKIVIRSKLYEDGIDRTSEYQAIFPNGAAFKTIFDMGCHMGFYLLSAWEEGADRCEGVEKNSAWAKRGQQIADLEDYRDVHISCGDALKGPTKRVDVTLCLNFLHHLSFHEATDVLCDIDRWTKERMVFVLLDPTEDVHYAMEPTPKGVLKLRISHKYLRALWPTYTITTMASTVPPEGRSIVDVRKPC